MTDNFLSKILATKRLEIEALKQHQTVDIHTQGHLPRRGFAAGIQSAERLAVVAEVKKASPSKGVIEPNFEPVITATTYQKAGATCISVLTDQEYFMGSIHDLELVKRAVSIPVLRKDFIIDEVQIDEAYLAGADAILLICAALPEQRLRELSAYARGMDIDVLVEVHSERELEAALTADASVIGVNNRDLTTFEVRLETCEHLIPLVPKGIPALAESGIKSREDAVRMALCGAAGILVGESLMRAGAEAEVASALEALRVPKLTPLVGERR